MKKSSLCAVVLLAVLAAVPAFASFVVDDGTPPAMVLDGRISHIGPLPQQIAAAKGMGIDMPLRLAVQQIAPPGWSIFVDNAAAGEEEVSWAGADSWIKTLNTTLASAEATASVDWTRKTINIKASANAAAKAEAAKTPAVVIPTWEIRTSDVSIKGTLERWARESKEGWQISWETPFDFPTTLEAKFSGSFEEALWAVIEGLSGSEAPVQAVLYSNKVVRIIPRATKR